MKLPWSEVLNSPRLVDPLLAVSVDINGRFRAEDRVALQGRQIGNRHGREASDSVSTEKMSVQSLSPKMVRFPLQRALPYLAGNACVGADVVAVVQSSRWNTSAEELKGPIFPKQLHPDGVTQKRDERVMAA